MNLQVEHSAPGWYISVNIDDYKSVHKAWLVNNIKPRNYKVRNYIFPTKFLEIYFTEQKYLIKFAKHLKDSAVEKLPLQHKPSSLIKKQEPNPDAGRVTYYLISTTARTAFELEKDDVKHAEKLITLLEMVPDWQKRHHRAVIIEATEPPILDDKPLTRILYKWNEKKQLWILDPKVQQS